MRKRKKSSRQRNFADAKRLHKKVLKTSLYREPRWIVDLIGIYGAGTLSDTSRILSSFRIRRQVNESFQVKILQSKILGEDYAQVLQGVNKTLRWMRWKSISEVVEELQVETRRPRAPLYARLWVATCREGKTTVRFWTSDPECPYDQQGLPREV